MTDAPLPDFQRGYKWDDERIQIVITVCGTPIAWSLLETNNAPCSISLVLSPA